jgi:hypothetical protein
MEIIRESEKNRGMKTVTLIYPHDNLLQDVKREASYYAERKSDTAGESLFEQLVFDEEYAGKFRELFLEARAEIAPVFMPFSKDVPVGGYFEQTDFQDDKNGIFHLSFDSFPDAMIRPLDVKTREFLTAYIMYRWLETKATPDAQIYYARAESLKAAIRRILNTLTAKPRKHGLWEL